MSQAAMRPVKVYGGFFFLFEKKKIYVHGRVPVSRQAHGSVPFLFQTQSTAWT